jgi:OOP family OmpA-OmpF porin
MDKIQNGRYSTMLVKIRLSIFTIQEIINMIQTKRILPGLVAGAMLLGLMSTPASATEVVVAVEQVFEKTVDNFIVLYDSSSSMKKKYPGTDMTSLEAARKILSEANRTLPNLDWNAGIYVFTPGDVPSIHTVKVALPVGPYDEATFGKAVEKLHTKASGPTLLQDGLNEAGKVIADLKGKTAVFVFTDGTYTEGQRDQMKPLAMAKELVSKYDTCIYAISSATGETEKKLIRNISELNECSMVIPFDQLLGRPGYTTGALYRVINAVIAVDVTDGILFDFNKSELKDSDKAQIQELGLLMETMPTLQAVLAGFTDGVGSEGYNLELSKRRSEAVRDYLLANFKIDRERVTLNWYGKADPIASNQTAEGRTLNRRVAVIVTAM